MREPLGLVLGLFGLILMLIHMMVEASKNPPPKTAPGDEQKKVENGTSKKR